MSFVVEIQKPFDFRVVLWQHQNRRRSKGPLPMPTKRPSSNAASPRANLTIPELEHAKAAALGTLVSLHSRRAYKNAIDKFIAWYCSEPRLGFNRAIVLRYRSFLESLSLSAATINLHLSAIRRLADEAAESSMLSPELAIGIRRVKGVKRLGTRIGNWLSTEQAQDLLNSIPRSTIRGKRDAALVGLLLGCGLRRSEAVSLRLDQIQLRECHWVVADLYGKGGRLRTVPVPGWCKALSRPLASCLRGFRRAGIQANLEKRDRAKSWDRSGCCLDSSKAICKADRSGSPGAARPSSYLRSALPQCRRRTRTDSIPARSRLSPNDGTVHWVQTEVQRCGQRSVPNITGEPGAIIRFIVQCMGGRAASVCFATCLGLSTNA